MPRPDAGRVRSTLPRGESATRNPPACSNASGEAVIPACASRAASMPLAAARPACSGLVMVPKLAVRPAARLAAMASACRDSLLVEPAQIGGGRGGCHRAEHAGRMPALGVMRIALATDQLRPHLVADQVRADRGQARCADRFALGEHRRHEHRARMAGQRHVVVVERVCRDTVDERSLGRAGALLAEQNARLVRGSSAWHGHASRTSCVTGSSRPASMVAIVSTKPERMMRTASRGTLSNPGCATKRASWLVSPAMLRSPRRTDEF